MMQGMLNGWLLVLFTAALFLWLRRIQRALDTLRHVAQVPKTGGKFLQGPSLTIVIPARNEEKNLPFCLKSIEPQLDSNISCLVINDRSTDRTETVLKQNGYTEIREGRTGNKNYLNLLQPPPQGWTGKNNALHNALPYLNTEWLLFTDADTLHHPEGLSSALSYAVKNKLSLLTLTPQCLTASFIEHLIQPSAMAMMGLWYPLSKVNQPDKPDHFANGQFLMIQRELYLQIGGHAAVARDFLEDFAIMKKAKAAGAKAACHQGQLIYGTRMYQTVKEIWQGWRRIYLHAAERSIKVLLIQFAELCIASILPVAGILALVIQPLQETQIQSVVIILAALWVAIAAATAVGTYQTLKAPRRYALLHPLAAFIVAAILLDAVRVSLLHLETKWRG